jgi:hypothetical protein
LFFAVTTVGALAGTARADDGDLVDETPPPSSAARNAETGAFLPSALSARTDDRRGMVMVMGGWDQARGGGIYDTVAEARLLGPISLLAGATLDGPGTNAAAHLELRLDTLHQATHGLDMAIAAGYTDAGFNAVPAAVLKVAIGRNVGASYLLANVVYEHGLEDGERAGELRLAALYPVGSAVHVGIDSRLQVDLEHDHDPTSEPDWESRSGLVASYAWNRIVFTGGAGISALRLRTTTPTTAIGPVVTAGFGTVF